MDSKDQLIHKAPHYNNHPSGVECRTIIRHFGFNLGSAVKYIWRADEKHECPIADLRKAIDYLEDEIKLRAGEFAPGAPCEEACRNYPAGSHAAHCRGTAIDPDKEKQAGKVLEDAGIVETDLAKYKRLLEAAGIAPSYQNNPQTAVLRVDVRGLTRMYFDKDEKLEGDRFPFVEACNWLKDNANNIVESAES